MAITLTKDYQKLAEKHLGSISGYDDCYLRLYGKYNSQNISANTTNYTLQMRIYNSGYWAQTGNCYAWISGTNYQNNTTLRFENGETIIGTKTETITHDDDGKKYHWEGGSFRCYAFSETEIGEGFYFPTINRYPSFTTNPSVTSKTETTITFKYGALNIASDLYYSIDNKTWVHITSEYTTITGLKPNTSYTIYVQARNQADNTLTTTKTLSTSTLALPTQSLNSKTETTIKINWNADSTIDMIYYSTNDGSTWSSGISVNATSGSYTISSLSENTTYKVKTRIRRKSTQTLSNTSSLSVTTYSFPYCTESPNFIIGNSFTLKFYNPLSRSISIKGLGADGNTIFGGNTSSTSLSGFNDSGSITNQYKSIPNAKSGKYQVQVTYGSVTKTRNNGNTYSIKGTEKPTFTNFTFADTNTNAINLTGNNQIFIKGVSNVAVTISTANKAVGNNSASISKYRITIGNTTGEVAYSSSASVSYSFAKVTSGTISVSAIDSRGLETTVTKTTTFKDWWLPTITSVKVYRENGIGTKCLFELSGKYWNNNFGNVNNTFLTAYYRYRKKTDSAYSSYINIGNRFTYSNGNYNSTNTAFLPTTNYGTTAVEFEVGVEYDIQFQVQDKIGTFTATYSDVLVLNSGIPCTSKQKKSDGTYSMGINKLPDENYALSVKGDILVEKETQGQPKVGVTNGSVGAAIMVGSGGTNRGLYDTKLGKWIVYSDGNSIYINGINVEKLAAKNFLSGVNLNDLPSLGSGIFTCAYGPTNTPTNSGVTTWHWYVIQSVYSENYTNQIATAIHSDQRIYSRTLINGTWTSWKILQYSPTSLYTNSSGATGTITLSETAANFEYLEIFYSASSGNTNLKSVKIASPNNKVAHLDFIGTSYLFYARKTISGTSVTTGTYARITTSDGTISSSTNQIYIYKVIGYK